MQRFRFVAVDSSGSVKKGVMSAPTRDEAVSRIESRGLQVQEVTEVDEAAPPPVPKAATKDRNGNDFAFGKASSSDSSPESGTGDDVEDGVKASSSGSSNPLIVVWRVIDGVFDFRFRRYLTPYILRVYWVLAILTAAFWVFISTFVTPFMPSVDPETRASRAWASQNVDPETRASRALASQNKDAIKPSQLSKSFAEILEWITESMLRMVAAVVGILFVRVAAELAIVLFNISNDLKRLKQPEPEGS